MPVLKGFVGSAYQTQGEFLDCQQLWNWYLERAETAEARSPQQLLPCPGFELFLTLPTSPVRALFAQNDRTFAVAGAVLAFAAALNLKGQTLNLRSRHGRGLAAAPRI